MIKFGEVYFNGAWVAAQTFEYFKKHEKHHGFTDEQMREVYDICVKKHKPETLKKISDESLKK